MVKNDVNSLSTSTDRLITTIHRIPKIEEAGNSKTHSSNEQSHKIRSYSFQPTDNLIRRNRYEFK